ncbi:MAG TPA: nickel-responsive transcriptional regulator NikR [Bacteroidota bacterium]|jgi:CopG family nickel-responsive transcriptional regulator|nr:nickel-responsive transcriptional regulator NikR [Bacteroidota bacterium]
MKNLTRFGVSMDDDLLRKFDHLIEKKGYSNRSEAIRDLVRDKFVEENVTDENKVVFGVLTTVYDHHQRELDEKLTEFQHDNYKSIISTTHIHINHHDCLEVIIFKDKAGKIKKISDKLLSFKGVKHGKLVLTSDLVNL